MASAVGGLSDLKPVDDEINAVIADADVRYPDTLDFLDAPLWIGKCVSRLEASCRSLCLDA